MSVADRLDLLAAKVEKQADGITTEEATKNAFIMPFIATVLGYDVFDPSEVTPEFVADVGLKKGEKIDYAILHDDKVQMLVECKRIGSPLSLENASQLYRYFAVTNARIAILTNGQVYNLYTDIDEPNRMDAKPFLTLDLLDIDATLIPEIEKLTKESFDLDSVIDAAGDLKYVGYIKRALAAEFTEPDPDFVRLFATKVYDGQFTKRAREQFTPLVRRAAQQFLRDEVNNRLTAALGAGAAPAEVEEMAESVTSMAAIADADGPDPSESDGIETTMEEIEGFQIIRAIVCEVLKPQRVVYRDAKSYCAVLVDDNNRKALARLHFNRKQKYLGLFDETRSEARHPIDAIEDIFQHAQELRASAERFAD